MNVCPRCGASYKRGDFGTDGDGHLIVIHICDRIAIERNQGPLPQSEWRQPQKFTCPECHRFYMSIRPRKRCPSCTTKLKRIRGIEFYRRKRGWAA